MTTCGSNSTRIFVLENLIWEYDENWNYVNKYYLPKLTAYYENVKPKKMISVLLENNTSMFYITSDNGVYQLDTNFNVLNAFVINGFNGICFNSATQHILVTAPNGVYSETIGLIHGIFIFNRFLTLIKFYRFPDSWNDGYRSSGDIEIFNGTVYVSTTNGIIWVLNSDEEFSSSFKTMCKYTRSLLIDPFGYIAVLCFSNEIYLYSSNGAYTNVTWTNLSLTLIDIEFDSNGNLAITSDNGIYLINSPKRSSHATTMLLD